jgi:hypothetical protein
MTGFDTLETTKTIVLLSLIVLTIMIQKMTPTTPTSPITSIILLKMCKSVLFEAKYFIFGTETSFFLRVRKLLHNFGLTLTENKIATSETSSQTSCMACIKQKTL